MGTDNFSPEYIANNVSAGAEAWADRNSGCSTMDTTNTNPNLTLRERIAEALREAIVGGELKPGVRLQELEIAAQYNTSRTPVREAFRQLESEGFLVIKPRRGATVTPITAKDIREFYEVKSVLEAYAAKRAVERLSDEDIDRMEYLNNELKRCYDNSDIQSIVPLHNDFHQVFVQACGNDRLTQLIERLVKQFQRFRIALSHTESVENSTLTHDEIIRSFRARDADRAASLVAQNAAQGGEELIRHLKIA